VTPSGKGLRIIGLATGPSVHRKFAVPGGGSVEVYRNAKRYVTITGLALPGHDPEVLARIDDAIDRTVAEHDGAKPAKAREDAAHGAGRGAVHGAGHDDAHGAGDNAGDDAGDKLDRVIRLGENGEFGGDRSNAVFFVACEMLRRGSADAAIRSVLLDRSNKISEHVYKDDPERCVRRTIERAREMVGSEAKSKALALTDLGNARRLIASCAASIRFLYARSSWLTWSDGFWRRDEDGAVMRMAKAVVEEMFAEAARIADEAMRNAVRKHALLSQNANRIAAMVTLARTEVEVVLPIEKLDADPMLLGVANGLVDLRTGTFREARPEDYITKRAGCAFDAGASCPNWIAFLDKVFMGDADLVAYVQRFVGYTLTGMTGEEVVCILWGTGANGKSTFRETVFALLGDYAVASDASLLVANKKGREATPELARLFGARLVTVNESQAGDQLSEARVKFITGHDTITARFLHENPFDFVPTHKTFMTTNHKPIVRGSDEGIWRRIHLWPLNYMFAAQERDVNFREKALLPELSGLLNWALEGLRAYQREGLAPPRTVMEATNEYREDMDIVGAWIEERCNRDPEARVTTSELHCDYRTWAEHEVGFVMSPKVFGRDLVARGFKKTKLEGGNKRGIAGLKLRPKSELVMGVAPPSGYSD
jgi:putative DNA primase/helicase